MFFNFLFARANDSVTVPPMRTIEPDDEPPLSRAVYIVLAILLGWLGIHNFYAGHRRAWIQLIVGLSVPVWYVLLLFLASARDDTGIAIAASIMLASGFMLLVSVLTDIATVRRDGRGRWMR